METKGIERLQNYWYELLARRDYSESELRKKAGEKGYELEIVSQGIILFLEQNLINDARLATNIVEFYGTQRGPMWLRTKLIKRGLHREIISDALEHFVPVVDTVFLHNLLRKYQITTRDQVDFALRSKLYRAVAAKGYTNIREIVDQAIETLD